MPEGRYLRILDTAPDAMVVVGADSKIVYVNAQTERLFGYSKAELEGQSLDVLLPERFRGAHHGHVGSFFAAPRTRAMGTALELFGLRKDRTEIAIEVSLSPVVFEKETLVSAAIRDITDRKRFEAATRLSAERLSSAVESIQDAFALFDAQDRIILCNSAFRTLVGDGVRGALVGRSYVEVIARWAFDLDLDDDAREKFLEERILHRRDPTATYEVKTRDGQSLRVSDRRTGEGGFVTTIWDLTDDVRHAEELREAQKLAEAGSAAKTDFLSSMSHELRTPLNAILGFAQLLQRDKKEPLSDRHRARVAQILKGGEHLLRLIDDILDLSRIEAGGISISTEPIDTLEVLSEVLVTLEPAATRAKVTLTVAPPDAPPPMISADRTRFAQILMNLGSNAIKYNHPGGIVTFTVAMSDTGLLRTTVVDTGLGVPLDKQPKLFQPFQRAGQETGPIEGTGIGLAITKRLTELMNGTVGFQSTPGHGSSFWIELPLHQSTPSTRVRPDRAHHDVVVEPRGKVLYVEDNPANVTFMRDLLGNFERIALLTAPNAELGIDLARRDQPELIIMDINLPGMSGLEALTALRAQPETKDIPVVALTAAASLRDRQRGESAGFHRYLTKPVKVDELESVLEEILGR